MANKKQTNTVPADKSPFLTTLLRDFDCETEDRQIEESFYIPLMESEIHPSLYAITFVRFCEYWNRNERSDYFKWLHVWKLWIARIEHSKRFEPSVSEQKRNYEEVCKKVRNGADIYGECYGLMEMASFIVNDIVFGEETDFEEMAIQRYKQDEMEHIEREKKRREAVATFNGNADRIYYCSNEETSND